MCWQCASDEGLACAYCFRPVCFDRREDVPGELVGAAHIAATGETTCLACGAMIDEGFREKRRAEQRREELEWSPPGWKSSQ
jgi:hypothetical protein